jgi:glycine/D-amino acid oxidase-like deaminating enzyme
MSNYWQTTIPQDPWLPLGEDLHVDVAIVGGGFMGLTAAYAIRQAAPTMRVIVVGAAGSETAGDTIGLASTRCGLTVNSIAPRVGTSEARGFHQFLESTIRGLDRWIRRYHVDCDYEPVGLLTVARSASQVSRLRHEIRLAERLGLEQYTWLDQAALRRYVTSSTLLGARFEPAGRLVNPAKLLQSLRARAQAIGVEIFEHTPVQVFTPGIGGKRHRLLTPGGLVKADRVVLTCETMIGQMPVLHGGAVPFHTTLLATEPLDAARLAALGLDCRQGIEDVYETPTYYRLSSDNRLLIGGQDVAPSYSCALKRKPRVGSFDRLERSIPVLFPGLRNVRVTHRWCGPVALPMDNGPTAGYLGRERRIVYGLQRVSHDLAFVIGSGQVLAELILHHRHPSRDLFFVSRRTLPLPSEPLRFVTRSPDVTVASTQDQHEVDPRIIR